MSNAIIATAVAEVAKNTAWEMVTRKTWASEKSATAEERVVKYGQLIFIPHIALFKLS